MPYCLLVTPSFPVSSTNNDTAIWCTRRIMKPGRRYNSSSGSCCDVAIEGTDRGQNTLFPAVLDDYVGEDNPVRAIDVFVDGLDLAKLGFGGVAPLATGRPAITRRRCCRR
jgi:hypothetical protein